MKEFKGRLKDWYIFYPDPVQSPAPEGTLGYIIRGTFVDHEDFAGEEGHTSFVVDHDFRGNIDEPYHEGEDIETMNSRYTLIGPAKRKPQRYGER